MTAQFHPPSDMLMDYASGALREAPSLVIATHLALCTQCRAEVARCEAVGGKLLEQADEIAVSSECRAKVMAMLDAQQQPASMPSYDPFICNVLPAPLRKYVGCGVGDVQWEKMSDTIDKLPLSKCQCSKGKPYLMRLRAGARSPSHTHTGQELTVVLSGSLIDGERVYHRGDFILHDATTTHAPAAGDSEDCVCLIMLAGSLRFKGLLGRLIGPFVRL